ncbi:D-isomer specific 2-hydroxyacid dehydrogenase [Paraphoma chrysanthemicola]|uniref:D-isomer specific 2-hydroxyacid dehydrogenase n=1 Tax=Paraphoma chrysanthemicola TaxID=798071 RepID=A0A8K0R016_9PLEO|nr:D-isomer specific 2-hydroxyacid dehydrogenase [Paraphoma chrysanthemicola]
MAATKLRLAILDDYQNIAPEIFLQQFPNHEIEIESFPDTLQAKRDDQRAALIDRLQDFDAISTMRERTAFPATVLNNLPRLKLILTTGAGNAAIDTKTCHERGITVIGTGAKHIPKIPPSQLKPLPAGLQYTAEQTLALILAIAKDVPHNSKTLAAGGWQTNMTSSLAGKTLGVLGLGRIGSLVARMAILGFGMKVIAWSSSLTQDAANTKAAEIGLTPFDDVANAPAITAVVSKLDLFRRADFVSIHYVLSERSRGIVGREEIAAMKSTASIINTSRGGLIDEEAMYEAVKNGRIRGVGLDVFQEEPLAADSPWRHTKWGEDGAGCAVLSPHLGYADEVVIPAWYRESAEHLAEFLRGEGSEPVIVRPGKL